MIDDETNSIAGKTEKNIITGRRRKEKKKYVFEELTEEPTERCISL